MKRSGTAAVVVAIALGATAAALASRAMQRDRAELMASFGAEQLSRLRTAIHEIEAELAHVAEHLAFTARLVASAESGAEQRRELEALLAVARSYRVIAIYDGAGRPHVMAVDPLAPPAWSSAPFESELAETARSAIASGGMVVSGPLADAASPSYRAFATPFVREGVEGALVVLVDLRSAFERLRLAAPDPSAKLLLLGPHGLVGPLTDPLLARTAALERHPALDPLLDRMRARQTGTLALGGSDAEHLGMGKAEAVAAFAPIAAGGTAYWSVGLISSTTMLQGQDRTIVLRTALWAAAFVLAPLALAAYVVASTRRARMVRERLRIAEQVAHLREKAEKILDNVPVGVIALDGDGRVASLNRTSRDRVPPSALGRSIEVAFPEAPADAIEALRALIEEARASGKVRSIVAQPLPLSGRGSYLAVHAVPLAHPLPDVKLLLVLEDVTELRALSSQLLRAEKLATVGILAAGITHEVGTPLGVIRGRAEVLAQRLGPASPLAESAGIIVEEIDRISRIIQELLDFSRLSRAARVSVSLQAVAAYVAELLAVEARNRKISVAVRVEPDLPPLAANPDQLKQVLVNLTLNAVHACAAGGHVRVIAQAPPRSRAAVIEVVDDGAGIPDSLRHRVFDPFFTTKKRGKGTGLGLTVAAQIVRNHGGEIDLDSAVGRGTRVVVMWPLASGGAEEVDGQGEARADSRGG